MTAPVTETPPKTVPSKPSKEKRERHLKEIGYLVGQRIGGPNGLQKRYLRNEARARGDMAALRKGAGRSPGDLPEIWDLTQVDVPDHVGDAPTWEEIAVHTAMTLYAVHQQSRSEPMFHSGVGLGHAARTLVGRDEENPSARARFNALVTSSTSGELCYHLRNFVSLLRARSIHLDHAMLADDITQFQRPGGAKKVRLRWARQYASLPASSNVDAMSDITPEATSSTSEK